LVQNQIHRFGFMV